LKGYSIDGSKPKIQFFGREFKGPSMSDMLGENDLKPKIVENV